MSRDLRRYTQQTNLRLFLGVLIVILLVGDGMIYVFYGRGAALTGLLCIFAGLAPLGLIWAFLRLLDWIVKRANEQ